MHGATIKIRVEEFESERGETALRKSHFHFQTIPFFIQKLK